MCVLPVSVCVCCNAVRSDFRRPRCGRINMRSTLFLSFIHIERTYVVESLLHWRAAVCTSPLSFLSRFGCSESGSGKNLPCRWKAVNEEVALGREIFQHELRRDAFFLPWLSACVHVQYLQYTLAKMYVDIYFWSILSISSMEIIYLLFTIPRI